MKGYILRETLYSVADYIEQGEPLPLHIMGRLLRLGLQPTSVIKSLEGGESAEDIAWSYENRFNPPL